jgi:hypothetical protein
LWIIRPWRCPWMKPSSRRWWPSTGRSPVGSPSVLASLPPS